MKRLPALVLSLCMALAMAADAPPLAEDPVLEKRVIRLASELRCLVCQNQSIADSNAELAADLRKQVREMLKSGKTEAEVREFMVQRYGDFVLYNPPVKTTTALLWAGPFVLLVVAVAALVLAVMRRRSRVDERELTPEEHERARALLAPGGEKRS
ncbi:MAG: cytochrome c-type biogenesis protein [Burkholderiales bacterium]